MPLSDLQKKPIFEDILVTSTRNGLAGEFRSGDKSDEPFEQLYNRLFNQINYLIEKAATLPGSKEPNLIKRLVTNEFFFYTKNPLTLDQFQKLMQGIMDRVKTLSLNYHLILGSFAVKREDDVVMNVAPYVQCGEESKTESHLNLIVKKYPSHIDPVFYKKDASGESTPIPNATLDTDVATGSSKRVTLDELEKKPININGKEVPFSYKNRVTIKRENMPPVVSCVDICLDHVKGATKQELFDYFKKLFSKEAKSIEQLRDQSIAFLCNQVIISNSIDLEGRQCLHDGVTHCDPDFYYESPIAAKTKEQTEVHKEMEGVKTQFGAASIKVRTQLPVSAYDLRSDLLFQLIKDKLNVDIFLDVMKEMKDFNINTPSSEGQLPLLEALKWEDIKLATSMIKDHNADCKIAFDSILSGWTYGMTTFDQFFKIPELKDAIDIRQIAQNGNIRLLRQTLIEGIEFKGTIEQIQEIKDEDCRKLLLVFNKANSAIDTMKLEVEGTKLEEKIRNYFLENNPKTGLFKALNKEQQSLLDRFKDYPDIPVKNHIRDAIENMLYFREHNSFLYQLIFIYRNISNLTAPEPTTTPELPRWWT